MLSSVGWGYGLALSFTETISLPSHFSFLVRSVIAGKGGEFFRLGVDVIQCTRKMTPAEKEEQTKCVRTCALLRNLFDPLLPGE